jgi:hypothetical protein
MPTSYVGTLCGLDCTIPVTPHPPDGKYYTLTPVFLSWHVFNPQVVRKTRFGRSGYRGVVKKGSGYKAGIWVQVLPPQEQICPCSMYALMDV